MSIHRIKGPTILLGSGTYYDFESPETSEITIEDYSYGLACAARFAGQCWSRILGRRVMYSVAEHVDFEIVPWDVDEANERFLARWEELRP